MLGLDEVDPLPVPSSPAIMQQMPSVKIPLQRKGEWGVGPDPSPVCLVTLVRCLPLPSRAVQAGTICSLEARSQHQYSVPHC